MFPSLKDYPIVIIQLSKHYKLKITKLFSLFYSIIVIVDTITGVTSCYFFLAQCKEYLLKVFIDFLFIMTHEGARYCLSLQANQ